MLKGKHLYRSSFVINIDHCDETFWCSFFANDDDDAITKLASEVKLRIGFVTNNIRKITLNKDNIEIRKFVNLEELEQESTKA